jgi:hypothetical protein
MSFQEAILPPALIADLYKKVYLVDPAFETNIPGEIIRQEEPAIKILGSNSKKISIVVNHPEEVFLPEKHLEFLSKILSACRLNIGDVAIINQGYRTVDINSIKGHLQPLQVVLFGIDPVQLGLPLNFPHFKIQEYDNCAYLSAPNLNLLNSDTDEGKLLKTKLWVCLKTMFEVDSAK